MYENKERKKKQQTIHGVDPGTQRKTWCVECNKTIKALHFVQCAALWSIENQYWQRTSALVNIILSAPEHIISHSMKCNNNILFDFEIAVFHGHLCNVFIF